MYIGAKNEEEAEHKKKTLTTLKLTIQRFKCHSIEILEFILNRLK